MRYIPSEGGLPEFANMPFRLLKWMSCDTISAFVASSPFCNARTRDVESEAARTIALTFAKAYFHPLLPQTWQQLCAIGFDFVIMILAHVDSFQDHWQEVFSLCVLDSELSLLGVRRETRNRKSREALIELFASQCETRGISVFQVVIHHAE